MNTKTQPVASEPSSGERADFMLLAVLRMPYHLAMSDEMSRRQFYDRAQQAAALLSSDAKPATQYEMRESTREEMLRDWEQLGAKLFGDAKPSSEQEDEYFAKRPQIDCNDRRMVFRAGFAAGRDSEPVAVPQGWQPIETAPKDFMTEFDGWNGERVPNVIWAHPEFYPKGEYAWCRAEYVQHHGWAMERVSGLTHWMPLPAAPSPAPVGIKPVSAMLVDRSDAVNLARNMAESGYDGIKPHGVEILCDAVLRMDAALSSIEKEND